MSVSFTAAEIEQLAVSPGATIYTAPANTTSQVVFANCTNESTGALTFTIHVVQSGGSLADTNLYVDGKSVGAAKSDLVPEIVGLILSPGDFIIAFGSAANALNLKLGIKEIL
jgi:hypothetical protein